MPPEDSSSSEEDCAALHAIAVSSADITVHAQKSAAQAAARLQATQPGWHSQTQHKGSNGRDDCSDADTLPEGFQLQLRKALERQLEGSLRVVHCSKASKPVAVSDVLDSGTGVRLFKRVKCGAAFALNAVNRRGAAVLDPLPATRLSERDMDSDAEETAHAQAVSAAVEPGDLLQEAVRAAASALPYVADPATYSDSDGGEGCPCGNKPPRAPPRGNPTAPAVLGKRRRLDIGDGPARRRKKRGRQAAGQLEDGTAAAEREHAAAPSSDVAAWRGEAALAAASKDEEAKKTGAAGLLPGAIASVAASLHSGEQERSARRAEQVTVGALGHASRAPIQAAAHEHSSDGQSCLPSGRSAEAGRGPDGAVVDSGAAEQERRDRKRAKKLKQKQQRAAAGQSEEQAALQRARRERKKQRLQAARRRKQEPAA